jgi:anti-sigma regulatory factor (Ser/Thr protein kinase)
MPRVLLIGHDAGFHGALSEFGALAGCEVVAAAGNVDAVHQVRMRATDVVVTDPHSPVEDDLALLDELRACRPGIRAIVLAPAATPAEFITAVRARVFACFVAPFDVSSIADMTRLAIDTADWRDGLRIESGLPDWISLTVSCQRVTADRLVHFMNEYRRELPDSERDDLMLAFREVLINAMEHGAGFDPEKVVNVTAVRTERAIVFHFRDPGRGFDRARPDRPVLSGTDPDPIAMIEQRVEMGLRPGGFGMLLAKKAVDEMFYNELGNEVLLIKRLA